MPIQRSVRRPRTIAVQWVLITASLVIFSRLWDGDWSYTPFAIFYGIVAGAFQLQWNRRLRDNPELRTSRRARRLAAAQSAERPLAIGTRVRVRRDPTHGPGPWPDEPTGVITEIAVPYHSVADTLQGPERQYWVLFDEPQRDRTGDGPYRSAEILERYLDVRSGP